MQTRQLKLTKINSSAKRCVLLISERNSVRFLFEALAPPLHFSFASNGSELICMTHLANTEHFLCHSNLSF